MRPVLFASLALVIGCGAGSSIEPTSDSTAAIDEIESWTPPPEYAEGKAHSDLSPEIVDGLRAIHAQSTGSDNAFIKVGDSITVSTDFLRCFASTELSGDQADLEATRTFFAASSWSRATKAAKVGWHTNQPLQGNPTPLAQEIADMHPSFAIVMLGTNDLYEGTQPSYERNLTALVDAITAKGIIPILSTVPPIRNTTQNAVVPKVNLIVRRVAATAKVPLMDFHLMLEDLPGFGLSGDGIHPFAASSGACDFSDAAMKAGYNQRNLLAITALARVKDAVLAP